MQGLTRLLLRKEKDGKVMWERSSYVISEIVLPGFRGGVDLEHVSRPLDAHNAAPAAINTAPSALA